MIEFFMPMIPPTVTAQEHKVMVRNGKPVFYDPAELKKARQKLLMSLASRKPARPCKKAVRLVVKWLFPVTGSHESGEWKSTKPDVDNLQKLLKDCMTRCGFWDDDALVASETVEKFWSNIPGIWIRVEELE